MASSENVYGAGGKFRKRSRRVASTPYDRPQSAIRRPNLNPNLNSSWFSKIVDPATKLIAKAASMFFPSVFQKQLGTPTTPEENHFGHEAPEDIANLQNPLDVVLESGGNIIANTTSNPETNGTLDTSLNAADDCETKDPTSRSNGVIDIEQLLENKTFTWEEFDQLSSVLLSRIAEPKNSIEKGAASMLKGKEIQQSIIEPGISQPLKVRKKSGMLSEQRNGNKSSTLQGSSTTNLALNFHIPGQAVASPEQIAREYIGSRTPKASHSSLRVGSQKSKHMNLPVVPFLRRSYKPLFPSRNPSYFYGIQEHRQNSFTTPRPRGRSTVYNYSRSPYFRTSLGSNNRDRLADVSTASPFVSSEGTDSSSNPATKRGRSVLENNVEFYDPIRRTRQKFLTSQSQGEPSSSGGYVSRGIDKSATNLFHVPAKSIEKAQKIMEQVDKLEASPGEKLSETKGSSDGDIASNSPTLKLISSITPKQDKVKENSQPDAISTVNSEAILSSSAASPLIKEAAAETAKDKASPELDMNKNSTNSTSTTPVVSATENKKSMDTPPSSFKTGMPSSSILKTKDDANEASNKSATKERVDFATPILTSRSPPEKKEASSHVPSSSQEGSFSSAPKTTSESSNGDEESKKQNDMSHLNGASISTSSKVAPTSEVSKQEPDIKTSVAPSITKNSPISQETSNAFSNKQDSGNGISVFTASSTQSPVFGFTSQATQPTSSSTQSPVIGFTSQAAQPSASSAQSSVFSFTSQATQPIASSAQSPVFSFTSQAAQPAASSAQSPVFGVTSQAAASSAKRQFFGATSQAAQPVGSSAKSPVFGVTSQATQPATSSAQTTVFSFISQATQTAASSAQSPVFGAISQPAASSAKSPVFGFTSQAAQPSFGLNNNSSSAPTFSTSSATSLFSSASQPASSMFTSSFSPPTPAQPVFGFGKQVDCSSASEGMSVDDNKTNHNVQTTPASGSNSQFAPQAASQQPVFQFGAQQNSSFQSPGNFHFSANGSFTLGSSGGNGGDKDGRRIIKVRRDKHKKK